MAEPTTSLLDPLLRDVTATGTAALRPYDRYGAVIPGLSWLPLGRVRDDGGECFLLRFEPGSASRPHAHSEVEEFLVLEGELEDSDGHVLVAGDFVSYAAGSRHYSRAHVGCSILVLLRGPNQVLGAPSAPDH